MTLRATLHRLLFASVLALAMLIYPAVTPVLALIAGWILREAMSYLVVFIEENKEPTA
jgi:hypothetical protein